MLVVRSCWPTIKATTRQQLGWMADFIAGTIDGGARCGGSTLLAFAFTAVDRPRIDLGGAGESQASPQADEERACVRVRVCWMEIPAHRIAWPSAVPPESIHPQPLTNTASMHWTYPQVSHILRSPPRAFRSVPPSIASNKQGAPRMLLLLASIPSHWPTHGGAAFQSSQPSLVSPRTESMDRNTTQACPALCFFDGALPVFVWL